MTDEIKSYVFGGVGNQLFQALACYELGRKYSAKNLELDFRFHSSFTANHPSNITAFLSDECFEISAEKNEPFLKSKRLALKIASRFSHKVVSDHSISPLLHGDRKDVGNPSLYGYFQDCWSNQTFEQAAQRFISKNINANLAHRVKREGQNKSDLLLHIRGGDFLKYRKFNICTSDYYRQGVRRFSETAAIEKCAVITDDINYARHVLDDAQIQRYEILQDKGFQDAFATVMKYKNRLLSNSTFAIWASEFGHNIFGESAVAAPSELTMNRPRKFYVSGELNRDTL